MSRLDYHFGPQCDLAVISVRTTAGGNPNGCCDNVLSQSHGNSHSARTSHITCCGQLILSLTMATIALLYVQLPRQYFYC